VKPQTGEARRIDRNPEISWARRLVCSKTGLQAPLDEPAFLSPAGAPWLVGYDLDAALGPAWRASLAERPWTLWRYRELLPLAYPGDRVDLGEGGTPVIPLRRLAPPGVDVRIKEEGGNPTGSFKARGLSLAVNRARELGGEGVELASAGNAAIAMAAYAAAAGLSCRVALPADAPGTVVRLCREFGAEVLQGGADLVEAGRMLADRPRGFWNLSTLKEPYRVEGKKTMGLELAEQLGWNLPDWIIYPTGGGTGIVGMQKAFDELEALGLVTGRRPRFCSVQMAGCAPIVKAFAEGRESATPWKEPRTRAWGLRVPQAIGDFLILRSLRESGGSAVAVTDEQAEECCRDLAEKEGLSAGPEGGAALAALGILRSENLVVEGQSVVVFQTGHPGNYR
jgi:threonine synthase